MFTASAYSPFPTHRACHLTLLMTNITGTLTTPDLALSYPAQRRLHATTSPAPCPRPFTAFPELTTSSLQQCGQVFTRLESLGVMLTKTPGSDWLGSFLAFPSRHDSLARWRRDVPCHICFILRHTPDILRLHPERSAHLEMVIATLYFRRKMSDRIYECSISPVLLSSLLLPIRTSNEMKSFP